MPAESRCSSPASDSAGQLHHHLNSNDCSSSQVTVNEHADSPLRKRPRLASISVTDGSLSPTPPLSARLTGGSCSVKSQSQASSGGDFGDDAAQHLNTSTPNHVTLDLRSAKSISNHESPSHVRGPESNTSTVCASTSDCGLDVNPTPLSVPEEPVDITADSSQSSLGSPPVVEIGEDDLGDINDPVFTVTDTTNADAKEELNICHEFPFSGEHSPTEAANMCAAALGGKDPIDPDWLLQIGEWIEKWLHVARVNQTRCQHFYLSEHQFWNNIASVYSKFLNRRVGFGGHLLRSVDGSRLRVMQKFFLPYIDLIQDIVQVDIKILQSSAITPDQHFDCHTIRHLRNLEVLFRPHPEETPLWRTLIQAQINVDQLQEEWAVVVLEGERPLMHDLAGLITLLANHAQSGPTWSHAISLCARSFQYLLALVCTRGKSLSAGSTPPLYSNMIIQARDVAQTLQDLIIHDLNKQTAVISVDTVVHLSAIIADVFQNIAVINHDIAQSLYPEIAENRDSVSQHEIPRHVREHIFKALLWKCVLKGRMELRVQAVMSIAATLVQLWKDYNERSSNPPLILRAASRWLENNGVLKYLIGVDSHPQLILRGKEIVGFLFVTNCWTWEMTDYFWSTMISHQDRRIVTAAVDVLSGVLSLAQAPQIYDFCKKLYDVPAHIWNSEIRAFMRSLLNESACAQVAEGQRIASALCVHVLQQSATQTSEILIDSDISKTHALAFELLALLSRRSSSQSDREVLYQSCLQNVKARTTISLGSVEAILAVSDAHKTEDMPLLARDVDLCRVLAQEICSITQSNLKRHKMHDRRSSDGFSSYLKLLSTVIIHLSSSMLPAESESNLWDHLIGMEASDDSSRDEAWMFLQDIVVQSDRNRNSFVDRLVGTYLPSLSPKLFSFGSLQFLEAATKYIRRIPSSLASKESEVIEHPLTNLIWNIILDGPSETIADFCTTLLSEHYADTLSFYEASESRVAVTHADLIDRCVAQLQLAVSPGMLRSSDIVDGVAYHGDNTHIKQRKPASLDYLAQENEQRFVRTLQFMQKFLADVKSKPAFRSAATEVKEELPTSDPPNHQAANSVLTLKYQAFVSGKPQSIRNLRLSVSSTFADLANDLQAVTGFCDIAVIHGGRSLDLAKEPEQLASSLSSKGLLIVRNAGKAPDIKTTQLTISTIAEGAVFRHFDTLYSFLDLPDKLSTPVYHFMNNFPPHHRIYDIVLQDTFMLQELFPANQHARRRTLYSLQSLHRYLWDQQSSSRLEERYILHGIRLLSTAFVDQEFSNSYLKAPVDQEVASLLSDCLLSFLKERPIQHNSSSYFVDEATLIGQLLGLLQIAMYEPQSSLASNSWLMYATIIEAALHSRVIWEAFKVKDNVPELHHWLLIANPFEDCREKVKNCIEGACLHTSSATAVTNHEFAGFYWDLLQSMILKSVKQPSESSQVLTLGMTIFSSHSAALTEEPVLRAYLNSWTTLLTEHTYLQVPGREKVDDFLLGITRLLSVCVSYLKSLKKPIADNRLGTLLYDKYLFPSLSGKIDVAAHVVPVLDDPTRKEIYHLILSLVEDVESYTWLIKRTAQILAEEQNSDSSSWNIDRARWLRAPIGYSGLRNLTNTCYMNSLLSQLFMNTDFRSFMIEVGRTPSSLPQTHELLPETQLLFANMQNGNSKFTDTATFANSVKPYDSDHIDVTVQMDVDEFYNLLFHRWESQMPSPEAKRRFRSFYGGQLVTQIKSADCDHVSERLEPFFAIQCDVKGKTSLADSLRAYIEGDAMEGENKYRCEACGGRLVNAVKRSCLTDLPNNLIFHLKRFDFDLGTLQRSKINDEFHFPDEIDMTQYHVDYLQAPEREIAPDVFELCGVLVHNGTAETGHYYSYIRLPQSLEHPARWAEFNDIEVAEFDSSKLPDQCFGGIWYQPGTEQAFPKSHNAYMLFYRRKSTIQVDKSTVPGRSALELLGSPIPKALAENILSSNESLLRRYCLFGATHAQFVKSLIPAVKNMRSASCSDDHQLEALAVSVLMQYLSLVFVKVKEIPDFELTVHCIRRASSSCGVCAKLFLDWIISNNEITYNLLFQNPFAMVRAIWSELIVILLHDLRRHAPQLYCIDSSMSATDDGPVSDKLGTFRRTLNLLTVPFPTIWKYTRAWDEYFGLCSSIAELGNQEFGALLREGLFRDSVELLLQDSDGRFSPTIQNERNVENVYHLSRSKRLPPSSGLVKFIQTALLHVDLFTQTEVEALGNQRQCNPDSQKYALTNSEQDALLCLDRRTKYMPFITRAMEAMEQEINCSVWYPGEIVATFLNAQPPNEVIARIAQTIGAAFKEWFPAFSGFVFKTALPFCQRCPNLDDVINVIRAAAQNAAQMAKHADLKHNALGFVSDYAGQGGHHKLAFFRELATTEQPVCTSLMPELHPLQVAVVQYAYIWAPALLLFDEREVRENTCELLHFLIFDRYSVRLGEVGPQPLDMIRTEAVRSIFDKCYSHLLQAEKLHMPRSVIKPILSVLERCAIWLHQLRRDTVAGQLSLIDDDKVILRYHDVKRRVEALRDEDGEAFSETEWASQFDEDSSDEFTEV